MKPTVLSSNLRVLSTIGVLSSAILLASCATQFPELKQIESETSVRNRAAASFAENGPPSVERVIVPRSTLRPETAKPPVPAHVAALPIDVRFPGTLQADLGTLVESMSVADIRVSFQWTNQERGEALLTRRLPFLGFKGNVGELLSALRTGLGVVAWYENGMIFLSDSERYAISLPQNSELMTEIAGEIESLGGTDVTNSLRGGRILYSATPTVQDSVIGPFLERMAGNLAVVNMQIAVVSLSMTDNTAQGFDWNSFEAAFREGELSTGGSGGTIGTGTSQPGIGDGAVLPPIGSGGGTGTGNNGVGGNTGNDRRPGTVVDLASTGLALSRTSMGNVFGTYGALTVAGAIDFLSNFGSTNVTQNVSLKTLSGSEVMLRSGQEVPYVSGVSTRSTGDNNSIGGTETETAQTGLTVTMTPHYENEARLVTLDVNVELNSILDFVELSAGNQIGTITQPLLQDQSLSNIVRIEAGRTVVIGGLQYDSHTGRGSEPAFLRERLENAGRAIGSRNREVTRNALFVILRPAVTVYVPSGDEK